MTDINLHLHIRITPKALLLGAAGFLLLAAAAELGSESFTMSTTYPAPSGIYNQMVTTGKTYLARDSGGFLSVGSAASPSAGTIMTVSGGNVGIGTVNAGAMLDVAGGIALKANGTNSGQLKVVWAGTSAADYGYYAVYAP